jgi:putative phage-type endonuclease
MQLVKIQQNTPEWKQFRRSHIGASDAVVIMELSPWMSPLKLYEEKVFGFEQEENPYMRRGKNLESIALEAFENETGLSMFPMVFQHEKIDWMSASFDGITLDRKKILEIKCPGKKDHELALQGQIPKKYLPQLYHQMEVAQVDFTYYYSFDGEKGVIIEVPRDESYIKKMIEKEMEFWKCLKTLTPPIQETRKK